jgi:ankyrin repeat protein
MRGLNEVIQYLIEHGADINARDFRGRTPYRIAEGAKQSFQFQAYPETAELLKTLGANIRLGIPGEMQERAAFYAFGEVASASDASVSNTAAATKP